MKPPRVCGWVLGWAVPGRWFADLVRVGWPEAEVRCFAPGPDLWPRLERAAPFDLLGGYSLGSHLLLADPGRAGRLAGAVSLAAPIWTFLREGSAGGRVSRGKLRALRWALGADAGEALRRFYRYAGLDARPEDLADEERTALEWGLDTLERSALPPRLPAGWSACCGTEDSLLDPVRLRELVPELVLVPGATHHPAGLLGVLADHPPHANP
ncbi:MAG: hypothetical protein ACREFX_14510 [Opitutaceae bacterium]